MHGYESVVGPVKGVYNQSVGANKPRGHSLLVTDRPNFVTILALVRDSTARLPNGEGTRSDICELLKDSQYLAPISQESYLHSVVSGALDRLHYEADPCVKYDTKRKIWIYLHRERVHQQQQGMAKSKKNTSQRKTSRSKQQQKESTAAAASMKEILQPAPTISSYKSKNRGVCRIVSNDYTYSCSRHCSIVRLDTESWENHDSSAFNAYRSYNTESPGVYIIRCPNHSGKHVL
ncbi:unnamed protein product, partial [Timema podura]|nr:unnamed protein product [Timema podura]